MRSLHRMVVALVVAAVMLPGSLAAQISATNATAATVPFELFVTFGDSLADTGNVYVMTKAMGMSPAIPPSDSPHRTYKQGRFSNGRVAFEHFWDAVRGGNPALRPFLRLGVVPKKGGVDFSFGGSASGHIGRTPGGFLVPGLRGQVDLFLAVQKGKLPARTLFAIITGSNDYLTTPPNPPADPQVVVGNIIASIEALYARGARTVMVVNVSDLGAVPLVAGLPQEQRDGLTALSQAHNQLLELALGNLAAARPALRLIPVKVEAVTGALPPMMNLTTPAVDELVTGWPYPFPASACLFVDATTCPNVPTFDIGPSHFFWDAVHPTEAVHMGLAQYMTTLLPAQ